MSGYLLTIDCLEAEILASIDSFCNTARKTKQHKYHIRNIAKIYGICTVSLNINLVPTSTNSCVSIQSNNHIQITCLQATFHKKSVSTNRNKHKI